jgi:hypothetical protein
MQTFVFKRKSGILCLSSVLFVAFVAIIFTKSRVSNETNPVELWRFFGESSIVVETHEVPLPIPTSIILAAQSALPPCIRTRRFLGYEPVYYVRTNGYTCAVWNCPTEMWDSELGGMSDEFRVWIKDDTAEVVPTPSFSPRGNPNSKPPRLTAEKALAIAEMKTGIRFGGTNVVEDVGDYFKIGFTTLFSLKFSPEPIVYAWVSKSDWTVCGNPFSQVPELTEQDILSEIAPIADTNSACDRQQPPNIYRVADMTIVTLPLKPFVRGWTPCIWIDNVTKKRVCNWNY